MAKTTTKMKMQKEKINEKQNLETDDRYSTLVIERIKILDNHNKDYAQRYHSLYESISRLKAPTFGALCKHDHLQ